MEQSHRARRRPDFHVLVLGDFSGVDVGATPRRDGRGPAGPIRLESPDDLLGRLRPTVEIEGVGEEPVRLELREIEDFHPDRLVRRIPELARRLDSIDRIVEERASAAPAGEPPGESPGSPGGPSGDEDAGAEGLLDDIVEDATGERPSERPDDSGQRGREAAHMRELRGWIDDVVAPHLESEETPTDPELRRELEADVARRLRAVLHSEPVRTLERLWRSLLFLASRAGAIPDVTVHVLDVPRSRLAEELSAEDPTGSALGRILRDGPAGTGRDTPFAVAVAAWELGPDPADLVLLNRLAMTGHAVGTPLVADAGPGLLGMSGWDAADESPAERAPELWRELRRTPAARSLSLTAPGFLLRLPYGEGTDPCEALPFEEVPPREGDGGGDGATGYPQSPGEGDSGAYLWGRSAFVAALALARAFGRSGWGMDPSPALELETRPIHVAPDGRVRAHPVRRLWTVDEARRARDLGITPVLGFRQAARLRLPGLLPVSDAGGPVASWWAG